MQAMDAMNLGFLAKHLVMTELDGEVEDITGGCYVWGRDLWVGLWDLAGAGNPEKLVIAAQAAAAAHQCSLGGFLLLTEPALDSSAAVAQLSEALYVYGYPLSTAPHCGPEMVQVLSRPVKPHVVQGLAILPFTGAEEMMVQALGGSEHLYAAVLAQQPDWVSGLELYLAQENGEPVGVAGMKGDGLASRMMVLWVADGHRRRGIGQSLLAHCAEQSSAAGKLLTSAWTYRTGKWRYYLNKVGFEEQLRAQYFRLDES